MRAPVRADFALAALAVQPFVVGLLVLRAVAPPSAEHWARADPILGVLPHAVTLWLAPGLALLVAALWMRRQTLERRGLARALRHAVAGALVVLLAAGLLRAIAGRALPAFVPAEEGAAPGLLLGLSAGVVEELLFRLLLLPLLYFSLPLRPRGAAVVAIVVVSLAFAVAHELGPGAFSPAYFVTRVVFPGCVMSLACFAVSPVFVVVAHGTAHLLMPALFS